MIKLKFKNRDDELKFFLILREIQEFAEIKIRYAECVSDLDVKDDG